MKTEEKSEKINRILGIISAVIGIVGSIFGIFQAQQAATLKNEVNSLQTASQLLGGHTVVGEESASREGRGGQDADPADFLCSQQRTEQKINAHCHPEGQQ